MKTKGNISAQLKEGIVPVIVEDADIEPKLFRLSVQYPNGTVKLGNELTPADTIKEPIVKWVAEPNAFYTLLMTDPDAPNRENPIFKEVEHWLVINIPGNKVSEGDCLTQYIGPGPPQGTGPHRYIFLLFKQQGKLDVTDDVKPITEAMKRLNFSTKKLMKKYNLEKIIAGNYFQAQWDTTVPEHILSSPILCTIL